MDISVFEDNELEDKGMALLRNRFFKSCAFCTRLQNWFKDNDITQIRQLGGYTTARKVSDIKLVITESSLKYLKFVPKGKFLEEGFRTWLDNVYEGKDTSAFGVVKTDRLPSNMGGAMTYTALRKILCKKKSNQTLPVKRADREILLLIALFPEWERGMRA
ncbi:MAG: hypothetical protein J6D11_09450, partial [Clostridia bacterium]|nr:hypothetical protein [Clostridia bacterium]